jgi:hypothetical protein
MKHRAAIIAGLALGLAAVFGAPQAFATTQLVVDLQIDYFAGSIVGPPIFQESSLSGSVQFYTAGLASPFNDVAPFLLIGPPIDIGVVGIGQEFSTRFIPGNPVDISRLGFSFGGVAAGFPAYAFAFPSDIPPVNPDADPILTVLANGPPIDVLLQGPPIRSSGAIFAYDDPVQVGTWSASVSAADVPEPATWVMLLLGFGAVGAVLRRARRAVAA